MLINQTEIRFADLDLRYVFGRTPGRIANPDSRNFAGPKVLQYTVESAAALLGRMFIYTVLAKLSLPRPSTNQSNQPFKSTNTFKLLMQIIPSGTGNHSKLVTQPLSKKNI